MLPSRKAVTSYLDNLEMRKAVRVLFLAAVLRHSGQLYTGLVHGNVRGTELARLLRLAGHHERGGVLVFALHPLYYLCFVRRSSQSSIKPSSVSCLSKNARLGLQHPVATVPSKVNIVTGVFVDTALQSSKNDREVVVQEELEQKQASWSNQFVLGHISWLVDWLIEIAGVSNQNKT